LGKGDLGKQVEERLVGRRREIRLILAAVKSGIPVLIEGGVGRGKTRVSLEVARALGRPFFRVDGAPDVTAQKIVGWFDPSLVLMDVEEAAKRGVEPGFSWDTFVPGPLTQAMMEGGVLFVNEGTRLPSDTWNALLTAMDERIVVIPKLGTVEAKPEFTVIVTANPMEHAGAYPLPEAAVDRFVWVPMSRQDPSEEREIIRREVLARGYERVAGDGRALDVIEACVDETYRHPDLVTGVSVRAGVQMGCLLGELGGEAGDENMVLQVALMAFQKKLRVKDNVAKTREQIIAEIVRTVFQGSSTGGGGRPTHPSGEGGEPDRRAGEEQTAPQSTVREEDLERKRLRRNRSEAPMWREVQALRAKAKERPEKVAEQLNSDPEYAKDVQGADPEAFLEVFHQVRPWLHEKVYDLILHTYVDSVLRRSEEIYLTGKRLPELRRVEYRPGGDLDWDETVERYTEKTYVDQETLVAKEPLRLRRSLVLMMDHSGSMAGRKLLTAALCTGVLSHALRDEEYSVLLFSDSVHVLKEIGRLEDLPRLIRRILEQPPKGYTDIQRALETGLEQLDRATCQARLGILITDGIHTTGDPVPAAGRYPTLHVLGVPNPRGRVIRVDNCRRMAEAGRGRFLTLRDYADVPKTVLTLLR